MPIGNIVPPSSHPDDDPLVCIQVNQDWIPYLIGMVWPAKYPEYWAGTLEQNRTARKDVMTLMEIISQAEDCDMAKECCVTPAKITRVDPDGGVIQVSYDGGTTWVTSPDTIQQFITIPMPPVTSGVAETKCDAATNVQTQVQAWIDQVLTDFDTATALLDFALAVAEAILAAVLAILSAGTLTVAESLILPAIAAAATAAWAAGKVVFEDYWTPEALSVVLCAAYCCIADDGSFNEAQFKCFWNKCNADLSASPAKMLFMGFLSSVGASGLSAMAASGTSADSDCGDCMCDDSCQAQFSVFSPDPNGYYGNITERDSEGNWIIVETTNINTNSLYYISIQTNADDVCCIYESQEGITGTAPSPSWADCNTSRTSFNTGIIGDTRCVNALQWSSVAPFSLKVFFVPCE